MSPRNHLGRGHVDGVPGEPKEVHPRNQDDLRRPQEEERANRRHRVPEVRHFIMASETLTYNVLFPVVTARGVTSSTGGGWPF